MSDLADRLRAAAVLKIHGWDNPDAALLLEAADRMDIYAHNEEVAGQVQPEGGVTCPRCGAPNRTPGVNTTLCAICYSAAVRGVSRAVIVDERRAMADAPLHVSTAVMPVSFQVNPSTGGGVRYGVSESGARASDGAGGEAADEPGGITFKGLYIPYDKFEGGAGEAAGGIEEAAGAESAGGAAGAGGGDTGA